VTRRSHRQECYRIAHPALVGYQAVQDLLPDILLVLDNNAFLAALLNGCKPVLEAFMLPGGPLLPFNPAMHAPSCIRTTAETAATAFSLYILVASYPFVSSQVARFILP
jgi:hypothetical protein